MQLSMYLQLRHECQYRPSLCVVRFQRGALLTSSDELEIPYATVPPRQRLIVLLPCKQAAIYLETPPDTVRRPV